MVLRPTLAAPAPGLAVALAMMASGSSRCACASTSKLAIRAFRTRHISGTARISASPSDPRTVLASSLAEGEAAQTSSASFEDLRPTTLETSSPSSSSSFFGLPSQRRPAMGLSSSARLQASSAHADGRLPYSIQRVGVTVSSLPVYTERNASGTKTSTIIRKCTGDLEYLREDMMDQIPSLYDIKQRLEQAQQTGASPFPVGYKGSRAARRTAIGREKAKTFPIRIMRDASGAGGKLVVNGDRVHEIRTWLVKKGF